MTRELPSDWKSRAKKVYKRDNYECRNCGKKGGPLGNAELHAHHGVPRQKGGTHKLTNLLTYCKECHNDIHSNSETTTSSLNHEYEGNNNLEKIQSIFRRFSETLDSINSNFAEIDKLFMDLVKSKSRTVRGNIMGEYSNKIDMQKSHIQKAEKLLRDVRNITIDNRDYNEFREEYHHCLKNVISLDQNVLSFYRNYNGNKGPESPISITEDELLRKNRMVEKRNEFVDASEKVEAKHLPIK